MRKINVGVVGLGRMGSLHARVYSAMEDVNLVAICDVLRGVREKAAARYGVAQYSKFEEMFKKENLDAVSVCVPTKHHHRVGLAAINEGINTLVEKPIASDVREANELIKSAKKRGVILMVGHVERFNPAVRLAKELIRSGAIGKVITLSAKRVGPAPPKSVGIDVILDLAIHDIDVMQYLSGRSIARVYADSVGPWRTGGKRFPDNAFITLKFGDGTIGTIETNWITPKKIRELNITGTKGVLGLDYILQEVEIHRGAAKTLARNEYSDFISLYTEGITEKPLIVKKEPLVEELAHFIKCVKHGEKPLCSGEDGKRALQIALLVDKSVRIAKPCVVT